MLSYSLSLYIGLNQIYHLNPSDHDRTNPRFNKILDTVFFNTYQEIYIYSHQKEINLVHQKKMNLVSDPSNTFNIYLGRVWTEHNYGGQEDEFKGPLYGRWKLANEVTQCPNSSTSFTKG